MTVILLFAVSYIYGESTFERIQRLRQKNRVNISSSNFLGLIGTEKVPE